MNLILRLTGKEILEDIYNIRFVILVLLCAVLIPLTLVINQADLTRDIEDYQRSLSKYEEKLNSGMENTLTFEASGFRPPSVLRIFCNGLDVSMPVSIQTTRREGVKSAGSRADDNPFDALFGSLDFVFIVKVVMSLIAIIFTFNAISGEREQGTLKLVLSNSIPRYKIVIAKYLGNLLVLSFPFTIGLVLGLLIIVITSGPQLLRVEIMVRILLMFMAAIIYISLFLNLGLLVSVMTRRSWTSVVFLLLCWVLFVLVVPQTSGIIAQTLYPVKSRRVLNIEKDIQKKSIEAEQSKELREILGHDDYDELRKPIIEKYQHHLGKRLEDIELEFARKRRVQWRIANALARLSPASSLTFVFSELSNTGYLELESFTSRAQEFQNLIERDVYAGSYSDNSASGLSIKLGILDLAGVPRFMTQNTQLGTSILAVEFDMFLLLAMNVILFVTGVSLFVRFDVR